jgi:hypothetical protein
MDMEGKRGKSMGKGYRYRYIATSLHRYIATSLLHLCISTQISRTSHIPISSHKAELGTRRPSWLDRPQKHGGEQKGIHEKKQAWWRKATQAISRSGSGRALGLRFFIHYPRQGRIGDYSHWEGKSSAKVRTVLCTR